MNTYSITSEIQEMPDEIPDAQIIKKLRYLLNATCSIILPPDTTLSSLPRDLLTCLKTLDAVQELEAGEEPAQFSTIQDIDRAEARKIVDAQLAASKHVASFYRK